MIGFPMTVSSYTSAGLSLKSSGASSCNMSSSMSLSDMDGDSDSDDSSSGSSSGNDSLSSYSTTSTKPGVRSHPVVGAVCSIKRTSSCKIENYIFHNGKKIGWYSWCFFKWSWPQNRTGFLVHGFSPPQLFYTSNPISQAGPHARNCCYIPPSYFMSQWYIEYGGIYNRPRW